MSQVLEHISPDELLEVRSEIERESLKMDLWKLVRAHGTELGGEKFVSLEFQADPNTLYIVMRSKREPK